MRWGMTSPKPSEGEDVEEADKDGEPEQRTYGWDESDFDLGVRQIENMRALWVESERARLSPACHRALTQFMWEEHKYIVRSTRSYLNVRLLKQ
jgi:hypothetical protein